MIAGDGQFSALFGAAGQAVVYMKKGNYLWILGVLCKFENNKSKQLAVCHQNCLKCHFHFLLWNDDWIWNELVVKVCHIIMQEVQTHQSSNNPNLLNYHNAKSLELTCLR